MAAKPPEFLAVDLFDRRLIGFAKTDELVWRGQQDGFVRLDRDRLSPNYINIRAVPSLSVGWPKLPSEEQLNSRQMVIDAYSGLIDDLSEPYDHLLGLPNAMTTLGPEIARKRGDSALSLDTQAEEQGSPRMIEDGYAVGEVVVGLTVAVRDGGSQLEAVKKVRGAGFRMDRIIALVDRQEGGVEALNEAGVNVYSALTIGGITAMLRANERITSTQVNWTIKYFQELFDKKAIDRMPPELDRLV